MNFDSIVLVLTFAVNLRMLRPILANEKRARIVTLTRFLFGKQADEPFLSHNYEPQYAEGNDVS